MSGDELLDDEALALRAQGGERAALGLLVARHYPSLLRLCRRLLAPGHEAEDVAQEAAVAACLSLGRLRDPARFGPWLHAIAANLARQQLRRRRVQSLEALGEPRGVVTLWSAAMPEPDEVAALREQHDAILAALSELSPLSREAVIGFYLEGYSYAELATLLGVPVVTLKGRLVFGRRKLQRRLAAWRPPPRFAHNPQKEQPVSQPELVPVVVDSVRFDTITQHRSVFLVDTQSRRFLSIFIGPGEAEAIVLGITGQQLPRPLTHDLSLRLLEPLGATVQRVVISRIADHTFFADIELAQGGQRFTVDARPSDALALAVRSGAQIFVAREVLEQQGTNQLPDSFDQLKPGAAPPPPVTVLLAGEPEAERDAIASGMLGSLSGLVLVHAEATVESILGVARGSGPKAVVIDLADGSVERLALLTALRQQAARLRLIALGGDEAAARAAGVTAHLSRPLDMQRLAEVVRDAVLQSYRDQA